MLDHDHPGIPGENLIFSNFQSNEKQRPLQRHRIFMRCIKIATHSAFRLLLFHCVIRTRLERDTSTDIICRPFAFLFFTVAVPGTCIAWPPLHYKIKFTVANNPVLKWDRKNGIQIRS